jgi:uncharacterized protein YndB with AHSA1/START domain
MTTSAAEARSIVVEYDLAPAPEKVWRVLTESNLIAEWLMQNDFKPIVGHKFTFRAQPVPGWDGVVHCEVLEVEAQKRLRYSWRGGADKLQGYGAPLDTTVTWTLTRTASGGTLLRLDHSGFLPANTFAFENMSQGWRGKVGQRIEAVVAKLG